MSNAVSPEHPPHSGEVLRESGVGSSDEDFICAWMEPKPVLTAEDHDHDCGKSPLGWWVWCDVYGDPEPMKPTARTLTLDAIHLVEERLTEEQWDKYCDRIVDPFWAWTRTGKFQVSVHAAAAQKIKALASVLRSSTTASPLVREETTDRHDAPEDHKKEGQ